MRLGNLGEQFVLKSRRAFELIHFEYSESADGEVYYPRRRKRDSDARYEYLKRERKLARTNEDIFMIDILREEMKPDDERLQRNIFE
jgi:hypothetical protein